MFFRLGNRYRGISAFSVFVILFISLFSLSANIGCSPGEITPGAPTSLDGKEPMVLVCDIQNNFKQLKTPVFNKIIYHEPRTEFRFAAGKYNWNESYDIILNADAYTFIQKYSPIEIWTALVPLILDHDSGADVLALLDGMKSPGKEKTHYPEVPAYIIGKYRDLDATQQYLKQYVNYHQGHYNGEKEKTKRLLDEMSQWDIDKRVSFLQDAISYSPFGNPKVVSNNHSSPQGTLEHLIINTYKSYPPFQRENELISDFRAHSDWLSRPTLDLGNMEHNISFDTLLESPAIVPKAGIKLESFISNNNNVLTGMVLLSLSDIDALGVLLDLHEHYWIIYTQTWRNKFAKTKQGRKYKNEMIVDVVELIQDACDRQGTAASSARADPFGAKNETSFFMLLSDSSN